MKLRPFELDDEESVIALWSRCDLLRPWNDPHQDIQRKLAVQPELFLIGTRGGRLIASGMAGYDGHRGNIYYVAVEPELQGQGLGRQLMDELTVRLERMGCPKVHVMIRVENTGVVGFYKQLGYAPVEVALLGRRLVSDA